MPLKDGARLDRTVRQKIGRLLRGFYAQLCGGGTPARFVELFRQVREPDQRRSGDASPARSAPRQQR